MSDLIETLRRSLMFSSEVMEQDSLLYDEELPKVKAALSLLSDRSALLWALLEEMAGEVSVKGRDYTFECILHPFGVGVFEEHGYASLVAFDQDFEPTELATMDLASGDMEKVFLCLARAIQEQRKREQERAVVEDFRGRISAALERGDLVRNPNGSLSISREVSGE